MKNNRRNLIQRMFAVVLLLAMICGIAPQGSVTVISASEDDGFYHGERDDRLLWEQSSDNGKYRNHRIPGIVVTKKDTVIVYCEARTGDTTYSLKDHGDWSLMDIYLQRSTDGGETFGDPIYIAKGNRTTACINNPSIIVGNDNTLHFLYCKNYSIQGGGIWYRKSTDDGLTWTEEREITQFAESVPHGSFAFGPGHGVCLEDGTLLNPVWLNPRKEGEPESTDHGPAKTYVFYSKDHGETWKLSDVAAQNTGETAIATLSDGSIILNTRSNPYRQVTTSPNGITNWTTTYRDQALPDPSCSGGMVTVDLPGLPYAQLFINCASATPEDRTKVTLRCSFDDCVTFEKSILLSAATGGYCDVAVDSRGKGYALYEFSFGKRVRIVRFSFYDEFIKGNEQVLLSNATDFRFDGGADYIASATHVETDVSGGVLKLTTTDTRRHSVMLDFSETTRNLNLSDYGAVALRVRVNTQEKKDFALGTYFYTGRALDSSSGTYNRISIPSDNEWHTVVMDLTEIRAKGMLRKLKLEMFSDSLKGAVGDTLEVESIRFFSDVDAANQANGSATDAPQAPLTEEAPVEKNGCKSAIGAGRAWMAVVCVAACLLILPHRKKKN